MKDFTIEEITGISASEALISVWSAIWWIPALTAMVIILETFYEIYQETKSINQTMIVIRWKIAAFISPEMNDNCEKFFEIMEEEECHFEEKGKEI